MGYTSVSRNLGVDVAALALVKVDLRLQDVNLLGLHLELALEVVSHLLHLALIFIVFVNKDGLVRAIQLPVQLKLVLAQVSDQVQQASVLLDASSELTLSRLELTLSILNLLNTSLLGLGELVLQFEDDLGRTTYFEGVQVDQVSETEHLAFLVLALLFVTLFLIFLNFLLLLMRSGLRLTLLLTQSNDLLVKLTLAVNELE